MQNAAKYKAVLTIDPNINIIRILILILISILGSMLAELRKQEFLVIPGVNAKSSHQMSLFRFQIQVECKYHV